jgi:hypothetical protein
MVSSMRAYKTYNTKHITQQVKTYKPYKLEGNKLKHKGKAI